MKTERRKRRRREMRGTEVCRVVRVLQAHFIELGLGLF